MKYTFFYKKHHFWRKIFWRKNLWRNKLLTNYNFTQNKIFNKNYNNYNMLLAFSAPSDFPSRWIDTKSALFTVAANALYPLDSVLSNRRMMINFQILDFWNWPIRELDFISSEWTSLRIYTWNIKAIWYTIWTEDSIDIIFTRWKTTSDI